MNPVSSPVDAKPSARMRTRLAWFLMGASLIIWSCWPLAPEHSLAAAAARSDAKLPGTNAWTPAPHSATTRTIDLAAFDAQLWKVPPKPVEAVASTPPPPPPPPPALKLQLVGIVTGSDGAPRVALFDPDSNKVQTVAVGDRMQRYLVKSIRGTQVELTDVPRTYTHTLQMRSALVSTPPGVTIRPANETRNAVADEREAKP